VLPVQAFIHTAGLSGYVLVAAAAIAILWANSPWAGSYTKLQHAMITLDLGAFTLSESLQHWVNDALMVVFFFVAGMEIKRELVEGELSEPRRAALPMIAAAGGMIVPAVIFYALNAGTPASRGWGVPMATDIAFALGVLALLGNRIAPPIRIFLLALAIVDDIGAILVIGIFYTESVKWAALGAAGVIILLMLTLRWLGVRSIGVYVLIGVVLWLATFESGLHATLAGVVLGLMTPTTATFGLDHFKMEGARLMAEYEAAVDRGRKDDAEVILGQLEVLCLGTEPPLERLERILHPWSSFVVLPIFALLNAGVALTSESLAAAASSRVTWGIVLGLIVGKIVGVTGASWLAVKAGLARLPKGTTWDQVLGVSALAGVGFTVSLFITDLAFKTDENLKASKIGILAASVLAGVLGYVFLRLRTGRAPTSSEMTASEAH
jgi:NhaA family Na+:H+ antiporter